MTNDAYNIEAPVRIIILYLKGVKEIRNCKGEYIDQKLANKEFSCSFKLGLDDVLDGLLEIQLAVFDILVHHVGKFELTEFVLEL